MQTWIVVICLINGFLGFYLGRRGFRATFVDAPGVHRLGLLLLATLPQYVTWWLQETRGFRATPTHIVAVIITFVVGLLLGKASARRDPGKSLITEMSQPEEDESQRKTGDLEYAAKEHRKGDRWSEARQRYEALLDTAVSNLDKAQDAREYYADVR